MPTGSQERKLARLDNDVAAIYDLVSKLEKRQARYEVRFERFAAETTARFDQVDTRLGGTDARLGRIDGRLGGIDGRLGGIDGRLGGIDGRLDGIDGRLDGIDGRLDDLTQGMATVIELVSRRSADG